MVRPMLWLSVRPMTSMTALLCLVMGLTSVETGEAWPWQDLITPVLACVPWIMLLLHWVNKMGWVLVMKYGIRKRWVYWTGRFNSYLWNIEEVLNEEQWRPVGAFTTMSRQELDYLEMLHRVDKEHRNDQEEMVQRFLDNGMKFRGYRNYLLDTMKNCEVVAQSYRATVTEDKPQGDPGLLKEMKLVIHILQQEQKNLDTELNRWTWD